MIVLAEVEAIINCHSLTYVSSEDLEEPLTPSHLLHGRRLVSLPATTTDSDINNPDVDVDGPAIVRRTAYVERVLNHFWDHWKGEYLMELRSVHADHANKCNRSSPESPKAGDVVVIGDSARP